MRGRCGAQLSSAALWLVLGDLLLALYADGVHISVMTDKSPREQVEADRAWAGVLGVVLLAARRAAPMC